MHLFRNVIQHKDTKDKVLDFTPPNIQLGTLQPAVDFIKHSEMSKNDFRMSDALKQHTGIDKIEAADLTAKVENKVMEKLQEIQEDAYQKAYELGLEEGREYAIQMAAKSINDRISDLGYLVSELTQLKTQLTAQNESHLIKLTFYLAKKIAMKEIESNPDYIKDIIKQTIQLSQADEQITLHIPATQYDFLKEAQKSSEQENEFLKKVSIQPHEDMTVGGCVIKTNYGEVDARIEERVNNLWNKVMEITPKVTDKVAS